MSVSSVKNLNGNEFSAVQDTSLTEFVQTNSASWSQGGADTSNIFYITKGVTPFSDAISAAKEGKTLIGITSGGGSIGTVTINDLNTNSPWLNICLFGNAGYQDRDGGGEKQWFSTCQLYTFDERSSPGWNTEGGWYNQGHPQADWNNTNGNEASFIRNKPVLSAYAYTSAVDNKLDTSSFSDVSSTFLTAHQDLSDYYTTAEADTLSSMLSGAVDTISSGLDYISGAVSGGGSNNYVKVITDSSATSQVTYGDLRALCEGHTEFDLFYDSTNRSRRYLYRCSKAYIDSTWCQVCFSTVPITDDKETDSELYGKQTYKVYDLEFIFWSVGDGGPSNDTIVYVGSKTDSSVVNHNFAERSIQSDWNETDTKAQTYIKNKPDLTSFITSAQVSATLTGYQTKLDSVNNIVLTASLPATPDANTLYLIPEA